MNSAIKRAQKDGNVSRSRKRRLIFFKEGKYHLKLKRPVHSIKKYSKITTHINMSRGEPNKKSSTPVLK